MLKHGFHESAGGARYSFLMGYNHSYDELARTQSISTGAVDGYVFIADAISALWGYTVAVGGAAACVRERQTGAASAGT